jgi:Tol biopolymer transport system component
VLLAGASCQHSTIAGRELPDAPIAIHYRTPEEARRRAEEWSDAQKRPTKSGRAPRSPLENTAIAHADDLGAYLGGVLGAVRTRGGAYPGRLALLDPCSGDVTVVAAARRGSVPLAWSRDRQRLLFAQPEDDDVQLWELRGNLDTVRPLTRGPLAHSGGCYASDGRIVAVEVDRHVQPQRSWIAVSGEGGREPFTPISAGPADHSPTCAPDGSAVAFVREGEAQRRDIWIAALQPGARPRRLAPGIDPRFSPDGEWVAFSAPAQRTWRLWRMRPDGSARAPLGRSTRQERRPAISPDGQVVAYVASESQPRQHLYLRRFDGSGDRILFATGDAAFPVW